MAFAMQVNILPLWLAPWLLSALVINLGAASGWNFLVVWTLSRLSILRGRNGSGKGSADSLRASHFGDHHYVLWRYGGLTRHRSHGQSLAKPNCEATKRCWTFFQEFRLSYLHRGLR